MASIEKGLAKAREGKLRLRDGEVPELVVAASNTPLATESLMRVKLNTRALRANRILYDEESPASSAYKMLRTRILQRMRRNGWTTLAVTGTCPDEGKTLTAINLAISLARDLSTSVMLVDLDLRKPSIARYLGVSPRYGIADYLQGVVTLERAAVRGDFDRLGFLLNERSFQNSSEMLTSPPMERLVARLKQGEGRIVIFDLPPLLVTDDMLAFCPLVDAILLVLSQGKTKQADLVAAKELLQDVNIVGTVLNRATESTAPYYYYQYGGYRADSSGDR